MFSWYCFHFAFYPYLFLLGGSSLDQRPGVGWLQRASILPLENLPCFLSLVYQKICFSFDFFG